MIFIVLRTFLLFSKFKPNRNVFAQFTGHDDLPWRNELWDLGGLALQRTVALDSLVE